MSQTRKPENIHKVGGAIFGIFAYMSTYRAVFEPFVPGGPSVKLQVGVLGLILIGVCFILLYVNGIYYETVR